MTIIFLPAVFVANIAIVRNLSFAHGFLTKPSLNRCCRSSTSSPCSWGPSKTSAVDLTFDSKRYGSLARSGTTAAAAASTEALLDPERASDAKTGAREDESDSETTQALQSLAATTIALLCGDEASASTLIGEASKKRHVIERVFEAYDVGDDGILDVDGEAHSLFVDLARGMVRELAATEAAELTASATEDSAQMNVARAHARRVLADDESGNTIDRVAHKLLLMADADGDGKIDLRQLAQLFETVFRANVGTAPKGQDGGTVPSGTFPQPLRALAGSLQLLPPRERALASEAADRSALWNVGVPGDDHTLRRVVLQDGDGQPSQTNTQTNKKDSNKGSKSSKQTGKATTSNILSLVGLGRSADASAYFLPELGIALDSGLHVSSLQPKTVLLTHGHRDHIGALPVHASHGATLLVPQPIVPLVRKFLLAEAQLNYGDVSQTDEQTLEALGDFNIVGVRDGMRFMLPKDSYIGSPTPLGIQVLTAPHKKGVPAVSYGIFRKKQRLKEKYRGMTGAQLGALLRQDRNNKNDNKNTKHNNNRDSNNKTNDNTPNDKEEMSLTESYEEGILFYTGDTTIRLLRERWTEILPKYKFIIHEVTFLGPPSTTLDNNVQQKGHTHYAQLHPWICAFPETTFICVHWSLRYGREEVLDFFKTNYGGVPKNVVLWL